MEIDPLLLGQDTSKNSVCFTDFIDIRKTFRSKFYGCDNNFDIKLINNTKLLKHLKENSMLELEAFRIEISFPIHRKFNYVIITLMSK